MKLIILAICVAAAYGEAQWDPSGAYRLIDDAEPAPKLSIAAPELESNDGKIAVAVPGALGEAHWDPSGAYRIIQDSEPVQQLSLQHLSFAAPELQGIEGYRAVTVPATYPYPTYPFYPTYPTYPSYPFGKPIVPLAASREYNPFFYDYKLIKSGDMKQ